MKSFNITIDREVQLPHLERTVGPGLIDTLFQKGTCESIYDDLVGHDGYPSDIVVTDFDGNTCTEGSFTVKMIEPVVVEERFVSTVNGITSLAEGMGFDRDASFNRAADKMEDNENYEGEDIHHFAGDEVHDDAIAYLESKGYTLTFRRDEDSMFGYYEVSYDE